MVNGVCLMKGITFKIHFFSAHFKLHKVKRFKDTYIIPLPSSIAGMIGSIFGVEREHFKEWTRENNLYCGAKLLDYKGVNPEYSILWKFDNFEDVIRSPDYIRILVEPVYIIGVAGKKNLVEELFERLKTLNFEAPIFGGNDYHFVKYIGDVKMGELVKSNKGEGYLSRDLVRNIYNFNGVSAQIYVAYVRASIRKDFVFVYNGYIESSEPVDIVEDGANKIFVHPAWDFISI